MEFDFRFLLICETAHLVGEKVILEGIFNTVILGDDEMPRDVKFNAVVGCVLVPEMHRKQLGLIAWKLDARGSREMLPGWVGTKLTLPDSVGPQVLPFPLTLPVLMPGYYGFDLWDNDGAFGKPFDPSGKEPGAGKLATYLFGIFTESSKGPMHLR